LKETLTPKIPNVIGAGAGAAGLAAAAELGRAGLSVTILKARDRIVGASGHRAAEEILRDFH